MEIKLFSINDDLDNWLETFSRGCFEEEARLLRLVQEYDRGERHLWVCYSGKEKKYLGYVTIVWVSDCPDFVCDCVPEIVDLYVLEEFRRKGVAVMLLNAVEKVCIEKRLKGIGLTVDVKNIGAQQLYKKLGYSVINKASIHGKDVFVMLKNLMY